MSESKDSNDDDDANRTRGNLIGLAAVVIIVVIGFLLMRWLAHYEQTSDCIAAGHRDCQPVGQP